MREEFEEVTRNRREQEGLAHADFSRRQLRDAMQKKVKTSAIGALSYFEKHFGHLWGHGKEEEELSELEIQWDEIWQDCRTEVLDNEGRQSKAVKNELFNYDVVWKPHTTKIVPREDQ